MRRLLRLLTVLLVAIPLASQPHPAAEAQAPLDFPVPGGHFYSQADGSAGASGMGYTVSNADGIPFLTYFSQTGGVPEWGYPITHRFIYQGFTVQIFQKAGFQWNTAAGGVAFLNIFDILSEQGYDDQLQQQFSVPAPGTFPNESGQPFSVIQQQRLALLSANPAIQSSFLSNPNWLNVNGLPTAPITTFGAVHVLRAQRSVYQQWITAVPWAAAGQVTVANGGDVAKTLGLWPSFAASPLSPQQAPLSAMTGPVGPQPTATPNPTVCNGDERILFNPPNPVPGTQVAIQVTSARASTNVNLVGPNNPQFQGSGTGGLGTTWNWTVNTGQPGVYEYDFYIGSTPCVRGNLNVGNAPAPTATPTACNGDEVLSFNPPNPNVGQQFSIAVTSARASTNVGLNAPFNVNFAGTTAGGRGTIWTWNAVPSQAGSFTFGFTVNGVTCATGTVGINQPAAPTATPVPPQACTGRERMDFFPNPATIGESVTVNVSNAAPGLTPQLSGPFNPQFLGAGPGGTDYSWRLTPGTAGEGIQYRYVVNEIPCTTGFLNVNAPPPGILTPTPESIRPEPTQTPNPGAGGIGR